MNQVAIIGDRDSVIGFRALGMTVLETTDPAEAARQVDRLTEERYAVVFVAEHLARANASLLREWRARALPAIILVPSLSGSQGFAAEQLRESVRRAAGMDLFAAETGTSQPIGLADKEAMPGTGGISSALA